jgi:DNA-binding NarL/FixJ family response regulator
MTLPSPVSASLPQRSAPLGVITPAEAKVLSLLRLGESNRGIAEALVLSPRTVESHVSRLLAKTGCRNRTQLTLWSLAHA